MINTIIFDFSRVLLFAKDKVYKEDLNPLHKKLLAENPNYAFLDYFELNEELLAYLETIKKKFDLYIFTSGSIQNAKEIKTRIAGIFRGILSAEVMGVSKKDPQAYVSLTKKLAKNPNEVIYIDDSQTIIQAASRAGLNTIQFLDNASVVKKISQLK
ncbi:MAG: HAD-IA family hydrolase [Candidatus Shapirobacteria bacterium]|jgi:HAD superfamily hydrolase (TIGR01509 family)